MGKKQYTLTSEILLYLLQAGTMLASFNRSFRNVRSYNLVETDYLRFYKGVKYLESKGLIKKVDKNSEQFLKLTKKGELEAFLAKAILPTPGKWDGKWRLIIFDIPEDSHDKRDKLRWLLKKNGFIKLQASVFVNPYPLNREAVLYLKETKLINYIRIIKVDEMDNDKDLRKKFNLK